MRRGERAIESKDGQKAILEHCRVCSLAFSGDEYPYVPFAWIDAHSITDLLSKCAGTL